MLRPQALGESGLLVLGGVLLVLPGLLTDVVGLMLLVPAVRRWLLAFVTTKVRTAAQQGDLLEGIAVEVEAPRLQPDATGQKPSGWTRP